MKFMKKIKINKKRFTALLMGLSLLVSQNMALAASSLLYVGSRDDEVSRVQTVLQNKGYFNHEVTGYFGNITKNAVMRFQRDENIKVDGIVGDQTRSKLYGTSYSSDDLYWLSRIVHAEAQGESYNGMLAVANCVINRVKSAEFPNSVKAVVFDKKHGVQYQPTINGAIYNTPSATAVKAAQNALAGENNIGKSMYFFNPKKATSNWISKNRTYYATIGNHAFYL